MLIDVLSLITPNQAGLGNNYLQDVSVGGTPTITYLGPTDALGMRDLVYMKGLKGYPWDWLKVGPDFFREILTELKWSQPNTGKFNVGSIAASEMGTRRFPRWIDYTYPVLGPYQPSAAVASSLTPGLLASLSGTAPVITQPIPTPGQWQFVIQRPETDYVIFDSTDTTGKTYGNLLARNTDNYVRLTFSGPYFSPVGNMQPTVGAATGDIPAGEDWILTYEWGGTLVNGVIVYQGTRERVYHRSLLVSDGTRRGYGRYSWDTSKWANGDYGQPTASSLSNKIMPMPITPIVPVQMVF